MPKLGEACYAEHRGEGSCQAVVRALADLDTHAQTYPGTAPGRTGTARRAGDIMHPGAECIRESGSLAAAARKMRDLGVGSLPICGADDRLHGSFTDRDIAVKCIADGRDPAQVRAADLAQGTLFWVGAAAGVTAVLREMAAHQIKRLPLIESHRLVGVISEADLRPETSSEHRLAEFVAKVYATRWRRDLSGGPHELADPLQRFGT